MRNGVKFEAMRAVDRAWLEMDEPNNPMIVSAIIEIDEVRSLKRLAACIVDRLLQYPRFRQHAENERGTPAWVADRELRLNYHVRLRRLAGEDPDWELRQAIAQELQQGLDRSMPLWRITLFPREHRKAVVLFRAHHALADGIALMQVLLSITDDAVQQREAQTASGGGSERPHKRRAGVAASLQSVNAILKKISGFVNDDMRKPGAAAKQLRQGREAVGALVRLLTLPEDNPQCFRERLSGHRVVGWNRERPFEPIRQFAKASNLKINDIFLAALAGAFREYLHSVYGAIGEQQNLRVSIPVNLRAGDPCDLGNHFGLVMLDLPVGVADRQSRLEIVAQRMQELKHSPLARAVLASLAAAGHMPAAMEKRLVSYLGAKTATIVSNLPGPKEALRLAGGRLSKLVFWPPQSGGVGIGISMLSYAGNVTVGVSADIHLVPDPQLLLAAFDAELDALLGVPATVEDRPLPREEVAAST